MQILKRSFTDFNIYNETLLDWHLEYNILSKQDFFAKVNMFADDLFALTRVTLKGKLMHSGLAPIGYRSFVIPIKRNQRFIWFNKGRGGDELLVYPKNCEFNAVTFNDFDVFVLSIKKHLLIEKIKELGCNQCASIFTDEEKELYLSESFAKEFYDMASFFLTKHITSEDYSKVNQKQHKILVHKIINALINYLDSTKIIEEKSRKSRKSKALEEVIDIIQNSDDSLFSVKELSMLTNTSERTLLYAFKEKYDITPSEYLKAYRLNKVKNELFALKNQNVKISEIAGKYHFWHMGQFAKDFKKHFGILPSEL